MKESPPQQEPQSNTPITLDGVLQLLNSKLVSGGFPSAIGAIAIDRARQSKWSEAGIFAGIAFLFWLIIRIANRLVPVIDRFIDTGVRTVESTIDNVEIITFKRQYLEALKTYCYALEVEGFRGNLQLVPLKEIFVPLRLDFNPDSTLTGKIIKNIWDLLPRDDNTQSQPLNLRLVIIADPGYGKTTLTRYLTLSYADGSYRSEKARELIPILLLFRTIHSKIQNDTTPTLPNLITQEIIKLPRCQDLQPATEWLMGWLNSGKCLVMLDGLDEVPKTQREKVSSWANWQMQAYNTPFILTSQPHGYDSTLFQGVKLFKIEDFDKDQKSDFIDKWYQNGIWEQLMDLSKGIQQKREEHKSLSEVAADLKKQLFTNSALNELAKNPMLLTIIAATHKEFESLPKERISIYEKILNLLLETRPKRRETCLTMSKAEDNQAVLQVLALRLSKCSGDSSLTPERFLREIKLKIFLACWREERKKQDCINSPTKHFKNI